MARRKRKAERRDPREGALYAGFDTHGEAHACVVIDHRARRAGAFEVPATAGGYAVAVATLRSMGDVDRVAVEGCASYGAGLCRALARAGLEVVEALRPGRRPFAQDAKTDDSDAERAALCALWDAGQVPKDQSGPAGEVARLLTARDAAVEARTASANRARAMLVAAPDGLRSRLRGMAAPRLMRELSALGGDDGLAVALRSLARRWLSDDAEAASLEAAMAAIIGREWPAVARAFGFSALTAAPLVALAGDNPWRFGGPDGFARACGTTPVPASTAGSGRVRLNRGGDRRANCAVHQVVVTRMAKDDRTGAYVERRRSEGRTKREAMRCLKVYVAREAFRLITGPQDAAPPGAGLAARRRALGLTQASVAGAIGVSPGTVSRVERGLSANPGTLSAYAGLLEGLEAGETAIRT